MSETPRYRCAIEHGELPPGSEIAFAKLNYQVGVGQRVEEDDEFDFEGVPGQWMDPLNEAARQRVAELVAKNLRRTMNAPVSAPSGPVQPPKNSGMRAAVDPVIFEDVKAARNSEATPSRPAPRRRAAKAN